MSLGAAKSALLLVGLSLTTAGATFAQPNLIGREIDSAVEQSRFELGPFRFAPRLRLNGGYDSNGLSRPGDGEGDVNALVAPGVDAALPMGNRALFRVYEELNFVYYRDLADLRDVYNVGRVGGAVGGRRFLVRIEDELREEKSRPSSELDVPLDQKSNRIRAAIDVALGWRHEVTFAYENAYQRFDDPDVSVDGAPVARLLDRVEQSYRLRLTRRVTSKTNAVVEGFRRAIDFDDDLTGRDADSSGARAGVVFTPNTNFAGQILLGYKKLVPNVDTQADYSGLIGEVDFELGLGERYGVGGLFTRDVVPSVLDGNLFFLENRVGASFTFGLTSRVSIRPGVQIGRNTYPRETTFVNAQGREVTEVVTDRFQVYSLALTYRLTPSWSVTGTTNVFQRESNFPNFTKDRIFVTLGMTAGL